MMDWQIKPFSRKCFFSGNAFAPGDRYISLLFLHRETREIERVDLAEEAEEEFAPGGELICRWSRVYEPPPADDSGEAVRKTAEGLFLALAGEWTSPAEVSPVSGDDEPREPTLADLEPEARMALRHILGLLLERRRILKTLGYTPDGKGQILEHRKLGEVYVVPMDEPDPALLVRIQPFLSGLVK